MHERARTTHAPSPFAKSRSANKPDEPRGDGCTATASLIGNCGTGHSSLSPFSSSNMATRERKRGRSHQESCLLWLPAPICMIEVAAAACVVALAGTYTMEPTILGLMQPGDVHEPLPLERR